MLVNNPLFKGNAIFAVRIIK